jgi:hypothetical protein
MVDMLYGIFFFCIGIGFLCVIGGLVWQMIFSFRDGYDGWLELPPKLQMQIQRAKMVDSIGIWLTNKGRCRTATLWWKANGLWR